MGSWSSFGEVSSTLPSLNVDVKGPRLSAGQSGRLAGKLGIPWAVLDWADAIAAAVGDGAGGSMRRNK